MATTTMISNSTTITIKSDLDIISSLHRDEPYLIPYSDRLHLLWLILTITSTITLTHLVLFLYLSHNYQKQPSSEPAYRPSPTQPNMLKFTHQTINLLVNLFLSLYGFYTYTTSVPHPSSSVPLTQKISGFPEFGIFGALQIGYNLYSLPMGLFLIHEPTPMVLHHIAALFVAGVSCFARCGFRYYSPFFFGVIEVSSVPLALMNLLRGRMEVWAGRAYKGVRCMFGVVFLLTRVVCWTPQALDVLRSSGLLWWTCGTGGVCWMGMGCFWSSCVLITVLQYYWGWKVVRGLLALVVEGSGSRGKKKN